MAKFDKSAYVGKKGARTSTLLRGGFKEDGVLAKNGRWVFYQNLDEYGHEELKEKVEGRLNLISASIKNNQDNSGVAHLRALAEAELSKELALIHERIPNLIIDKETWGHTDTKSLMAAINAIFGLSEIYEANRERLLGKAYDGETKNSEGKDVGSAKQSKIDISSVFLSYFSTHWKNIFADENDLDRNTAINYYVAGQQAQVENTLSIIAERCLNMTIDSIIKSTITNKKSDDRRIYSNLELMKGKLISQGIYGKKFAEAFRMDNFVKKAAEALMSGEEDFSSINKLAKKKLTGKVGGRDAGNLAEEWRAMVINELGNFNLQLDGVTITATRIGQLQGKPDMICTFGTDLSSFNAVLEKYSGEGSGRINRAKFLKAWEELNEEIKKLKGDFIILTNKKDYTIYSGFEERGGFKAGSGGNLMELEQILRRVNGLSAGDVGATIFSIMQTASGAVGEGMKGDIEFKLAEDIAFFLFDDINMIGKQYNKSTGNVIHTLDLDGMQVPLSTFLFAIADALEAALNALETSPTAYVSVTYDIDDILYPTGDPAGSKHWTRESWEKQRESTYHNTTFTATFLGNFRKFIEDITT